MVKTNILAELGNLLILAQLEHMKNTPTDSAILAESEPAGAEASQPITVNRRLDSTSKRRVSKTEAQL